MQMFRFKDLNIHITDEGPKVGLCVANTCAALTALCRFGTCFAGTCKAPTFVACRVATLPHLTTIFECTGSACGGSVVDPTGWLEQPELDLGVLRQQLQAQLAQVDELEKAQAEASRPQTLAEAEDLERKLKGALEELQAQKRTLKK
jgi:hypothetical protein